MRLILIILALFILTFTLFGKGEETGVLFRPTMYGEWSEYGDEKKDGKYLGGVNNGLPNEQGTFTINNGVKYVGEWKGGKRHGQGTLTLPDGEKYEGEWQDGEKHGQGTETLIGGGMYVGDYKNGLQDGNGIFYDKNGKITYRVVNGKMVKE